MRTLGPARRVPFLGCQPHCHSNHLRLRGASLLSKAIEELLSFVIHSNASCHDRLRNTKAYYIAPGRSTDREDQA